MITSSMKRWAGVVCIIYILVQTFQAWVFAQAPAHMSATEDFLFSAETISVVRSWLMLFSMFGLLYIFFVICFSMIELNKASGALAFTGFFVFFLLEIILRSVELLYTQIQLPAEYAATTDIAAKTQMLSYVMQFQSAQLALYFPLGLSQTIGSFIVAFSYSFSPRFNYALKAIMAINGFRLLLRMITVYGGLNLFPADWYDALYLPLVYLTFGVMAWWFFKSAKHVKG